MQTLTAHDLQSLDRIPRLTLINALSGIKGAHLIGTADGEGKANLAIFNSVIHIGSNPACMGFLMRPLSVARHTYDNIHATRHFTINHVREDFFKKAHHTAANFPDGVSEFEETGLTPQWSERVKAPYVQESLVRIGLEWIEEHSVEVNKTILMVGKILEVHLPDGLIQENGLLDLEKAGSIGVGGLDAYYRLQKIGRLSYARPEEKPRLLNDQ